MRGNIPTTFTFAPMMEVEDLKASFPTSFKELIDDGMTMDEVIAIGPMLHDEGCL